MKYHTGIRIVAISILAGSISLVAAAPQPLLDAAEALRAGSEIRAWELVSRLERIPPRDALEAGPDVAVWLAEQYRLQRRFDEAVALANTVINAGDAVPAEQRAAAMLVKGKGFATQQNYVAARLEFRSITEHDTYRDTEAGRQARFLILDILRRTGEHDEALATIDRLRDMPDPETRAMALYQRAHIAFDRQDYEETREFIDKAKDVMPDLIENLFLEARLNLIQDRLQDPELEIGLRVLSTYVIPGRPVSLRMHDRNLAIARGQVGIPIEISTAPGGDREVVTLLASPRDPTLFRATVPTRLGPAEPGNNMLEVKGEDIVSYKLLESFQRENDLSYEAKTMIVVADAELTASSGDWVSADDRDREALQRQLEARVEEDEELRAFERQRDTTVVRPGNPVYVQVVDADRSISDQLDAVFVTAVAASGDRVEGVELTETGPHTGVFRGQLETETAPPQATASGTADGSDPVAPLSTRHAGAWRSAGDAPVWYAVDLMAAHPLTEIVMQLGDGTGLQNVSLVAGSGNDAVTIASTHPSPRRQYGYVDLADHFTVGQRVPTETAGYIYTEIDGAEGGEAILKIGSCDGVVAWLNGERVHNNQGGRVWRPEQDTVTVTLQPGRNSIMLRVSQLTGPWGASLTVTRPDGQGWPTLTPPAPAQPGVVTRWHLFNRLTPENIRVQERVNVAQPIRIRGELFRWIPVDVTPPAHISVEGDALRTVFNDETGRRNLRWQFEELAAQAVVIESITADNRFDERILPVDVDYSLAGTTRVLELGPGDTIEISYHDERRVREDEMIYSTMRASFHNAVIGFFYDLIGTGPRGERVINYDRALRYMPGDTERLVIQVADYDADISRDRDRIRVLVTNAEGDRIWLECVETDNHSGVFRGVLRLGTQTATETDTIAAGPDGWVRAAYADRENTDGVISRTDRVTAAPDSDPTLQLYRSVVTQPEPVERRPDQPVPEPSTARTLVAEPTSREAPLMTSIESPLAFEVIYPTAALRMGSRLPVTIRVTRDDGASRTVDMALDDGETGTFAAAVPLRIGSPAAYTDLDLDDDDDDEFLYVFGGDAIHVAVESADGRHREDGWFKLASDATLRFTDRNYEGPGETVHVGDYIYILVRDLDMSQTDGLDSVTVSLSTGDRNQTIELTETLPNSGIFTGRIRTRAAGARAGEATGTDREPDAPTAEPESPEPTLAVGFGSAITATYRDQTTVQHTEPVDVRARLGVHRGADGQVAGFTKRFSSDDMAVRTRLLTAEALFEMAKDYSDTGQEELAAESLAEGRMILEEAIIDFPHTKHAPHAEYLLANLAEELGDYQDALARFNRVLTTWPDSDFAPKSQLKKGIVLEALEDFQNAMDAYVELTYTYPGSELVSDAVIRMGQYFYRVERYEVSGRVFSQFHATNPEHPLAPRVLFLAAQSFLKGAEHEMEQHPERRTAQATEFLGLAASSFESLIDQYDDPALVSESLYWAGDVYLRQGELRQAYMAFRRLTFDYPESRWARFARGRLAENAERFSRITD